MRDNVILLFVILLFIIGYFKFTSKINKDQFINANLSNVSLIPNVSAEKVSNKSNNILNQLVNANF